VSSPPSPPPLLPSPDLPPPPPCGNLSLALHPQDGLPGPSGATASCTALSHAMSGAGATAPGSNDSWRELEFCTGCADAEGCVRFCDCLMGKVPCPQLDGSPTHVIIGHRRSDSPWGSLLPISILIFFGGFMCQMYIKNNRGGGGGGGLGGRGRPEEEGTELLGCMPRGRRRPDEDHEKMMPSQRREAYRRRARPRR